MVHQFDHINDLKSDSFHTKQRFKLNSVWACNDVKWDLEYDFTSKTISFNPQWVKLMKNGQGSPDAPCWCYRKTHEHHLRSTLINVATCLFGRNIENHLSQSHPTAGGVPSDVVLRLAGIRRCHAAIKTKRGETCNDATTTGKWLGWCFPCQFVSFWGGACFMGWDGMTFKEWLIGIWTWMNMI